MLKNGVHFTTPELKKLGCRYKSCRLDYEEKQSGLVEKAVETAATYLPLVESASALVRILFSLCYAMCFTTHCTDFEHTPLDCGIYHLERACRLSVTLVIVTLPHDEPTNASVGGFRLVWTRAEVSLFPSIGNML